MRVHHPPFWACREAAAMRYWLVALLQDGDPMYDERDNGPQFAKLAEVCGNGWMVFSPVNKAAIASSGEARSNVGAIMEAAAAASRFWSDVDAALSGKFCDRVTSGLKPASGSTRRAP